MIIRENMVVSLRYRFFDDTETPLHGGRWFTINGLIGGDDIPEFISQAIEGKHVGNCIVLSLAEYPYNQQDAEEELVDGEMLPDCDFRPGNFVSILNKAGHARIVKIGNVTPEGISAVSLSGNPYQSAYMEIFIDDARWATPEEFLNRRAKRIGDHHGR